MIKELLFEGSNRSWGVLLERDGKDYPSNAFAILAGNGGLIVFILMQKTVV